MRRGTIGVFALVTAGCVTGCGAAGGGDQDREAQEVTCPASIPAWRAGTSYAAGTIVAYKGAIHRCLQAHVALETWNPEAAASLWERVVCSGAAPPPPTGPGCGDAGVEGGKADSGATDTGSTDTGTAGDTGTPPPPPPSGKIELAPYFYTWGWGNPAYPFTSLVDLKAKSGLGAVTLAFVLADGACKATREVQGHLGDVKAFVAAGGRLKASFGGAEGTYLENACGDADGLAKAISDFVTETGVTDLDFDVEQAGAMNADVNKRRAQALAKVQKDKGIKVAFTLACTPRDKWGTPGGLSAGSLDVVKTALAAGVDVSHVNLMTMDYGAYYSAGKTMGELAISAATDAKAQLQALSPGLSEAAAWAKIGITPMIGQNDVASEVFTVADAKAVASFAKSKGVGLLAFWAINRDQPGSGSLGVYSLAQSKTFEFTAAFQTAF